MASRSSGSWSGARGADVIDLDKFMRGVLPHRARRHDRHELVVDSGALPHKPSSSSESTPAPAPRADPARAFTNNKRFSHDSGVSDGSYVKRRSRAHRVPESSVKGRRGSAASGSGSMRAFRAACERTLRDQQRQLARVALLCERLGERRARSATGRAEPSNDSSELSSSSRSTRDPRRRDKNRAQECKTYKIIMSKLDELNRVFVSRRSPPPPARRRPPLTSSLTSVSVSNKLVATDDRRQGKTIVPRQKLITRRMETEARQLVERAVGEMPSERTERTERNERSDRSARLANLQAINNAYSVDIAPREAVCRLYPNIATESVVKRESSNSGSQTTIGDHRCAFDLNDPIQLYAQAKRLQALQLSSRRARSSEPRGGASAGGSAGGRAGASAGGSKGGGGSLCALCREYWRAVRGYLTSQVCGQEEVSCA